MKKSVQVFYIILFAVLIVLPTGFFALFKGHFDTTNYENRDLAEFPEITWENIDGVPGAIDSWFSDHLPFRNQLLYMNGRLDYDVLKTSSSDAVIVGKDGWLYYKGSQANNEDPVGDYTGTDLFTDGELETIAANMTKARDELASRGARFVIFLCPNKERVYSEYMPDGYGEPAENCRLQQVYDYLTQNTDIPVVNALDDLMAYKQAHPEQQLYYKYDTHWNNIGAYVGVKTLNSTLGYEEVALEDCTVTDAGESTFDLARLLHLANYLTKDHFYTIEKYTPHYMDLTMTGLGRQMSYKTDDTAPGGKLFIIGDSFSSTSMAYYACHYQESFMTFYYDYTVDMMDEQQPDTVVYESVERYLGNMLDFSITDGIGTGESGTGGIDG